MGVPSPAGMWTQMRLTGRKLSTPVWVRHPIESRVADGAQDLALPASTASLPTSDALDQHGAPGGLPHQVRLLEEDVRPRHHRSRVGPSVREVVQRVAEREVVRNGHDVVAAAVVVVEDASLPKKPREWSKPRTCPNSWHTVLWSFVVRTTASAPQPPHSIASPPCTTTKTWSKSSRRSPRWRNAADTAASINLERGMRPSSSGVLSGEISTTRRNHVVSIASPGTFSSQNLVTDHGPASTTRRTASSEGTGPSVLTPAGSCP